MLMAICAVFFAFAAAPAIIGVSTGQPNPADTDSVAVMVLPEKTASQVEGAIKTAYGVDGRPVFQSEYAKGPHEVYGTAKLQSGVDTIELNTGTNDGRQDISFLADSSYFGSAQAFIVNGAIYTIIPISGKKFIIVSSDTTDTAKVRFRLEGH